MNKSQRSILRSRSVLMVALIATFSFAFLLTGGVYAASTIGTNMSATGTFTQTVTSATAAQFQNAAGSLNTLTVDTANNRVGVGTTTPQTTFEVQGTASASYFLTGNTIQVGGFASVAYNRFGTSVTGYANFITTTNDVLVSGDLEVDGSANFDTFLRVGSSQTPAFYANASTGNVSVGTVSPTTKFEVQGTASASYFLTGNTIQVAGFASVAYSRFGTGTTGHATDIDVSNDLLITGALEVDGKAFFDGTASVAGDFEAVGIASASSGFFTTNLIVGSNVASSSSVYLGEFGTPTVGTASFMFANGANSASTTGTCFQLKDTAGNWIYMRFNSGATTPTLSTIKCHQ